MEICKRCMSPDNYTSGLENTGVPRTPVSAFANGRGRDALCPQRMTAVGIPAGTLRKEGPYCFCFLRRLRVRCHLRLRRAEKWYVVDNLLSV